jgi:7-keto-8-aminopelargonate synthetase-like enzyme
MFYIKGVGGYLCSTEALKMNQRKGAPAFMNATALEYSTKEEADKALATALAHLGNVPNKLEVVEE